MPGTRRTAALAAAFLLLTAGWATAESPQQHALKAGTAGVFVTDGPVDVGRREGDVVSVHLRNDLVFEGTVLAAAGTRAELVFGGTRSVDGKRTPVLSLDRFRINAGPMPVHPVVPIAAPLPLGAEIPATPLADVDHFGDRWSIRIPFPFRLSGDRPASAYTPTPARTASPRSMLRREPTPTPTPSPAGTTAPTTPLPTATKIPAF